MRARTEKLMIAFWVSLSFFAMLLPALACFSKLKRDKRHTYRHAPAAIPNKYVYLPSGFYSFSLSPLYAQSLH